GRGWSCRSPADPTGSSSGGGPPRSRRARCRPDPASGRGPRPRRDRGGACARLGGDGWTRAAPVDPMRITLLSDAHLQGLDDPAQQALVGFLDRWETDRFVLCGDIFDVWWGWRRAVY